tara:strand:- start:7907 stop:8647 length:741 start_codon:yes stop_codon:yes gene_type:complete
MKILSWNVAGIRACFKKSKLSLVNEYDIVCFQETKCEQHQFTESFPEFPHKYWHATQGRKGLHGTSIWSKTEPLSVTKGLPNELDTEGRVITAEYDDFVLVTVYTPNSKADLSRLDERVNEWDVAFRQYVNSFGKPSILCGDFNTAYLDLDIYNPDGMHLSAGFTYSERNSFGLLLDTFVDVHRQNNINKEGEFTFWPYTVKVAREKNMGWRLDYFLVSKDFAREMETSILKYYTGSDHCPIALEF